MDNTKWANIAISLFFLLCCGLAVVTMSQALTPKGLFVWDPVPSDQVAALLPEVQLKRYDLVGIPGHKVQSSFEVENNSGKDVKNIKVLCELLDEQKGYLDREQWLLSGLVPSGKTMEHISSPTKYIHTRTAYLSCSIADFTVVDRPLFAVHRADGGHGAPAHDTHGGDASHLPEQGETVDH